MTELGTVSEQKQNSHEVDILMATCNGAKYIDEQLASIINQVTAYKFKILVSDDISSDETMSIIIKYKEKYSDKLEIINFSNGKNRLGVMGNFSSLIEASQAPYILFSDQDDIWFEDKVQTLVDAVKEKENADRSNPVVFFCDTIVINDEKKIVFQSFHKNCHAISARRIKTLLKIPSTFLVTNFVAGMSMGFNRALCLAARPLPPAAEFYDRWLCLVASIFGELFYIERPLAFYRLHQNNAAGATSSAAFGQVKRGIVSGGVFGKKKIWMEWQLMAVVVSKMKFVNKMTKKHEMMIKDYSALDTAGYLHRKLTQLKYGIPSRRPVVGVINHLLRY